MVALNNMALSNLFMSDPSLASRFFCYLTRLLASRIEATLGQFIFSLLLKIIIFNYNLLHKSHKNSIVDGLEWMKIWSPNTSIWNRCRFSNKVIESHCHTLYAMAFFDTIDIHLILWHVCESVDILWHSGFDYLAKKGHGITGWLCEILFEVI